MRNSFPLGLLLAAIVLSSAATAQNAPSNSNSKNSSKATAAGFGHAAPSSLSKPATTDPAYVIGPDDVLQISVWKEPDLSGTVPVRPDGKISLPLLSDVQAAGHTPMFLSALISDKLKQYVTDPHVTVVVTGINSKRVFLVGEVHHVGSINMLPQMTILQALASAGGFTQFANEKKIYVLRNENGRQVKIPVNYKTIISGRSPEKNILLQPGDTIVVP